MNLFWLIALAGLGTYATRLLPMLGGRWIDALSPDGYIVRYLKALGVTAITSLIVVSVADLLSTDANGLSISATVCGAATVIAAVRWLGNVGIATLLGALVYALINSGAALSGN